MAVQDKVGKLHDPDLIAVFGTSLIRVELLQRGQELQSIVNYFG